MRICWMEKISAAGWTRTLSEEERGQTTEMARRYGEVARLLIDTGLIVVSTTNPFGLAYREAAQTIRTLVHPAPVIAVHMSKTDEESPPNTDVVLSGPTDFDAADAQIMDELKRTRRPRSGDRRQADLSIFHLARDRCPTLSRLVNSLP